ncbi:hypothetical protein PtB15_3B440 [Puccinia triticina]|nr:hypothetical protein PtB15_3B440 [Puccinia triticina]
MVDVTCAKLKNSKNAARNKNHVEDGVVPQREEEERPEGQQDERSGSERGVAPGIEPVKKSAENDLQFEEDEIIKTTLKGKNIVEDDFVKYMKAVPGE